MATLTPTWTENVALRASAALAFGVTETNDIDLDNIGADQANVTIEIIFGSTPDGDVVIDIFPSTDSGVNDDTVAIASITIPFAISATVRKTIAVVGHPYLAVAVTNNDSADNVTYEAWYAWRNWNSA